jgi:hypothetical protein
MIPVEVKGQIFDGLQDLARMLEEAPQYPEIQSFRSELARLTAELRDADATVLPPEATLEYAQGLLSETDALIAQVEAAEKAAEKPAEQTDDFMPWDGDEIARGMAIELNLAASPPPPAPATPSTLGKPGTAKPASVVQARPPIPAKPLLRKGGEYDSFHD